MEIFNESTKPHVKEILLLCDQYHIPAFMTFAVANGEGAKDGGTDYITEMLSSAAEDVSLVNDNIVRHALVVDGFDVAPFRKSVLDDESELMSSDSDFFYMGNDTGTNKTDEEDPFAEFKDLSLEKKKRGRPKKKKQVVI